MQAANWFDNHHVGGYIGRWRLEAMGCRVLIFLRRRLIFSQRFHPCPREECDFRCALKFVRDAAGLH